MKSKGSRNFLLIVVLIAATGAAMAYSSKAGRVLSSDRNSGIVHYQTAVDGILGISAQLVQDKVLQGSDGTIGLNLTLQAGETAVSTKDKAGHVDMIIVLDRSGSMKGRKISDARQAVLKLLSSLTAKDRLGLVTYSDGVQLVFGLQTVTPDNRRHMESAINSLWVGGGTNLGAGLQAGIDLLGSAGRSTNTAKVILISDGLANKGITDVRALGGIASLAVEREFGISTVGVGAEFNEYLMTAIADQGTGSYYYLENPAAFAEIFQKEFNDARTSIVNNLKIQMPLDNGIDLVDAGGYPIRRQNGLGVFYPGSMHAGQTRKFYLTLKVPTNRDRHFKLGRLKINYHHDHQIHEIVLEDSLTIACVKDQRKVYSSIDKTSWSDRVINDEFNRLKQEVAGDIRSGRKKKAMQRIETYLGGLQPVNAVVGSDRVAQNLDKDLKELEAYVEDTFKGAPESIRQQQKTNAKALQYEGYQGRRK
jgi:Ca-activated chloride channel family protein